MTTAEIKKRLVELGLGPIDPGPILSLDDPEVLRQAERYAAGLR